MSFESQSGSVGFRAQGSKGTYAINSGAPAIFTRIKAGALGAKRDLMIPDPEIGGNRDVSDALLGPVSYEGTYESYGRLDSLASWLYYALGAKSSTSTGSTTTLVGTHVIKQVDNASVPWVSVEENIANNYINFEYTDAKANTLHLEADANGYLMGNIGMVALSQLSVPLASTTAAPVFDTSPLVVGTNITLSFGGVQLPAKSFSLDINNNLETNDFRLGSLFLGDAAEKRRLMTLGAKIRPADNGLLRQAMYGTPTAVSPGGVVTKAAINLTCTTYEFIGTTTTAYSVTFAIGKGAIKPFAAAPSGDNAIEHDLEIQVLRPDPSVDLLTATVVNHQATVV